MTTVSNQAVYIQQDVVADANNSSSTNLDSPNYTFTGTATSTLGIAGIQVSLYANKNCTVKIQQSPEGTTPTFITASGDLVMGFNTADLDILMR